MTSDPDRPISEDPSPPEELEDEADFDELARTWELLGSTRPESRPEGERESAWRRVQGGIRSRERAPEPERETRSGAEGGRRWPVVLAMAAGLAALAFGVQSMSSVEVRSEPGTVATVELRDGSTVELNSGSSFTHSRWTLPWGSDARGGRLEGEAYFQVVPGDEPFRVETFNGRVVVTGTQFAVRAWEQEGTEVFLASGAVRLEDPEGLHAVEMAPGERSSLDAGADIPGVAEPAPVDVALAWRGARGYGAVDRPLGAIIRDLARRFDRDIRVAEGVDPSERLTLHYSAAEDLRTILSDITTARGLRFRETSRGFEVLP